MATLGGRQRFELLASTRPVHEPSTLGISNDYLAIPIYSAQVISNKDASILVESGGVAPISHFVKVAAEAQDPKLSSYRRPKKKTRLDVSQGSAARSSTTLLPLQRITIDFLFGSSIRPVKAAENNKRVRPGVDDAVSVSLQSIDATGEEIRLTIDRDHEEVLVLSVQAIPNTARNLLLDFVHHLPTHSTRGVKASPTSRPASSVHCSLCLCEEKGSTIIRLQALLNWNCNVSGFFHGYPKGRNQPHAENDLLHRVFPDASQASALSARSWNSSDFYDSISATRLNEDVRLPNIDSLETELYPFQQRAVDWMRRREAYDRTLNGSAHSPREVTSLFSPYKDADGITCHVSHLLGKVQYEKPTGESPLSGGLLAEEMGLGKTVELIALLLLHTRPSQTTETVHDKASATNVTPSGATLIVTPPSILQQWVNEFKKHAPLLRVLVYEGVLAVAKGGKSKSDSAIVEDLSRNYDVVLTTYNVLAKEIHFATDPPDRSMRHARKFERRRSPLVLIQWWRVCIDEAQMIESGVSAAARVACRIPRVHAWAVSGTPLRKDVQDLHGLLVFLRYRPLDSDPRLWTHLVANHLHLFRKLWSEIALRHNKSQVRRELGLPPQRRFVLTLPFTATEQQHYSSLFKEMCSEILTHSDGSPSVEDWDPKVHVEGMRTWLMRLRQTCLHPQVGHRNRRALGRRNGPLRTVGEVLQIMIEQNEIALRSEEREHLNTRLLHAHILGNDKSDEHRSEKALHIYSSVLLATAPIVDEARSNLKTAIEEERTNARQLNEEDEDDPDAIAKSVAGRLRGHLRKALQLRHTCLFFTATAYFQIKSNDKITDATSEEFKQLEGQETQLYEEAKVVRRELLMDSSNRAESSMHQISTLIKSNELMQLPQVRLPQNASALESRRLLEDSTELYEMIQQVWTVASKWRQTMAKYLTQPLVDEDDGIETTGEEYEQSTKQQDELYAYFDCVKAIQADLATLVTGESAPLIELEVRTMIKEARTALDPTAEIRRAVHAPELLLELLEIRNALKKRAADVTSLRGVIQKARNQEALLQLQGTERSERERVLVSQHIKALQSIFSTYNSWLINLEKETQLFRTTQNQRLDFYRQLQELSDDVSPYKEELDEILDEDALKTVVQKEKQLSASLTQLSTKHRFLLHLQSESTDPTTARLCVICQCTFENGVLTVCGHQYCKECIQLWWIQHRTCPVCKRRLNTSDFNNVTYKPQEIRVQEEDTSKPASSATAVADSSSTQSANAIYAAVDRNLLNEIKGIDLPSSYGTKIDTIGRHLHWLRQHDAGTKSIIFSQFREFLDVLGTALSSFKIGHARFGKSGAVQKFREDASIDCLLLDAKTDSSGLTLVNATNVFICEPLTRTAVELQAIARVHRIGQTRPTTVWMYIVEDTVEGAIYDISVERRLAHVERHGNDVDGGGDVGVVGYDEDEPLSSKNTSRSRQSSQLFRSNDVREDRLEAADTAEFESAPLSEFLTAGKSGGEAVDRDDLWRCLFGKGDGRTSARVHELSLSDEGVVDQGDGDAEQGDLDLEGRVGTAGDERRERQTEMVVNRFARAEAAEARRRG